MLSSIIDKVNEGYFVLEFVNGSKLTLPMIHLQWFDCKAQSMEFKFTTHIIILNIVNPDPVLDYILENNGIYLKEYGIDKINDRYLNAPYIHKAETKSLLDE